MSLFWRWISQFSCSRRTLPWHFAPSFQNNKDWHNEYLWQICARIGSQDHKQYSQSAWALPHSSRLWHSAPSSLRPQPLPANCQRMRAFQSAKQEMTRHVSQTQIDTAHTRGVSSVAKTHFQIGHKLLWYFEKPIGKRIGLFVATGRRGLILRIDDGDRTTTASIVRVKPYFLHLPLEDRSGTSKKIIFCPLNATETSLMIVE